jgi:hypothetical protein
MSDRPFPFGGSAPQSPDPDTVRQAVATIAARDPLFNLDAFLADSQQAFWLVGQAHAQCKPELCAGVLAPALAERERAAITEDCRDGHGTAPGDSDAESGQLISIASDASHDTIVVHFVSTWRPAGGGRGKPDRRVQNWCFQRPAGAQTVQAAGAGERCRNCGALLSASVGGTCRYCGTPIGTGDGWRIIRVDGVQAQEAATALAAMQSIVATMASAATAARLQQGLAEPSAPVSTPARRGRRVGCGPILLAILVLAGLGFYAVESSGSLHHAVATVVPSIRHPRLQGPLDLTGAITAGRQVATQVPPTLPPSGATCAQASQRTAWNFKAKLPDGSTFHLEVGLPPGTGAAGVYKRPGLTVSANAQNASRFESWTAATATTAVMTVAPDGGGDLQFTNLTSNDTGIGPLSGHLVWSCALA